MDDVYAARAVWSEWWEYKNKGHKQNIEAEIAATLEKSSMYVGRPNSPLTCPYMPILPVVVRPWLL